ncbi:ArsR/SmtB family transcription factor [Catenulispora pinisilvae]|uniref:ArsR/SmtB family transcription factor n=1 Tax=Catenulispora pinisilvae TaxID=2705253 RepID=UPI00189170AC|nr:helix-turn-helix domain-containing protein [Catenulispora pinisilvae]
MDTQVEQYELSHPGEDAVELTAVLSALAEPVRLTIVRTVGDFGGDGGIACLEVWDKSGLTATKSTMSHHYKVLREAGLVVMWWVGAKKHVRLRRELMDVRWPGLLDAVLADRDAPRLEPHEKR